MPKISSGRKMLMHSVHFDAKKRTRKDKKMTGNMCKRSKHRFSIVIKKSAVKLPQKNKTKQKKFIIS